MLRCSLAELGLYVPANPSIAEMGRAVTWHIDEGGLTEAHAHEMALDCVEDSNKHVYTFDAAKSDLAKWTPSDPVRVVGLPSANMDPSCDALPDTCAISVPQDYQFAGQTGGQPP